MQVIDLDFDNPQHVKQMLEILSTYSQEDGGGNKQIDSQIQSELPRRLREVPGHQVLAAVNDAHFVGIAICLTGFSTFKAKPVLNIHDLAVLPDQRGKGTGTALLTAAEARAVELGCCKVTLEVIETNTGARALYERCGFASSTPDASTLFLEKTLPT